MGRRDELIQKYAESLRKDCDIEPDMALLERVTKACGPSIYRRDAETVSTSDGSELETVKRNFLIKRLGLPDDEHLMGGIQRRSPRSAATTARSTAPSSTTCWSSTSARRTPWPERQPPQGSGGLARA